MELLYTRYLGQRIDEGKPRSGIDLRSLFSQLFLMSDADVERTLELLRILAERYGLTGRDRTFEDILDELEKMGLIRRDKGDTRVDSSGRTQIRDAIFDRVFQGLSKGLKGGHTTPHEGKGPEKSPHTRSWEFGDSVTDLDFPRSFHNSLVRKAWSESEELREEDLEIYESESISNCSTVLMLDISHSMILYGEDRITPAKMVAMSLVEYIHRRFPRDTIDVITFGDEAKEIPSHAIADVSIGPFHTNTCDGLRLAQRILRKRRNPNKQIFMVTDGKPSAVYDRGRLYRNSFGLDPLVLSKTYAEANSCRKNRIRVSTFMIAQDNYLIEFVETFTRICQGKAFYTGLGNLGEFIFVDYNENRRRRLRERW